MLTKRNGDPAVRNSPPKRQSTGDFRPDGDGARSGHGLFAQDLPSIALRLPALGRGELQLIQWTHQRALLTVECDGE
jgi:hypothetical protein